MLGSRPLTTEEAQLLKGLFIGKMAVRNLALFVFGANTGFRITELLSLRLGDVLEEGGKVKDRITVSRRFMKGKRSSRNVVLNEYAQKGLVPWLVVLRESDVIHKDDFIFRSYGHGNKAIGRVQAWKILTKAYKAGGLTGKLGTHAMRKTFANNVYRDLLEKVAAGEPIDAFRSISKALGHKDIKSTDQYLSFLTTDIDETIKRVGV